MYPNLRAEMARYGVRPKDITKALDLSPKSVSNKMSCRTGFTLDEAIKIRDTFFPGMGMDDLFAKKIPDRHKTA